MPELVADAISDILSAYGDMADTSTVMRFLNRIHRALTSEFRIVTKIGQIAFDGLERSFAFDETWTQCWSAAYLQGPYQQIDLDETSVDQLNTNDQGWRYLNQTIPTAWGLWQDLSGAGTSTIFFDNVSPTATPTAAVTGVSIVPAGPCVITAPGHGLSDGDPYIASGIGGAVAANTSPTFACYAKYISPTQFSAYYDSALTNPVKNTITWTSGGTIYQYPLVLVEVSYYAPLTQAGYFPSTLKNFTPYVQGVLYEWAQLKRGQSEIDLRNQLYESAKDNLGIYVERKQAMNEPQINRAWSSGVATR